MVCSSLYLCASVPLWFKFQICLARITITITKNGEIKVARRDPDFNLFY